MKTRTPYAALLFCVLSALWLLGCGGDTSTETTEVESTAGDVTTGEVADDTGAERGRIVVLGNSIAAGYGLDPSQAFPALLQQKIDALGWDFEVVNAGVSGETTAGGLRRLDWLLREPVDVLIVELGGNDGLRGTPVAATRSNLQQIIERTRDRYPDAHIILAGMQIPPNLGPSYAVEFQEVFPTLAREMDVELIPFLLEGVGGVRRLNLSDGIHPSAEGHKMVAETVWQTLRPVLDDVRESA